MGTYLSAFASRNATAAARGECAAGQILERLGDMGVEAALFGSCAKGCAGEHSDVDILVFSDVPIPTRTGETTRSSVYLLANRVGAACGISIDIVFASDVAPEGLVRMIGEASPMHTNMGRPVEP